MYQIARTKQFKKDYKNAVKRGKNPEKLREVIRKLASGTPLEPRYRDHALTGSLVGYRECHIEPDWLLVYYIEKDVLVLTLYRTGTHSDLF